MTLKPLLTIDGSHGEGGGQTQPLYATDNGDDISDSGTSDTSSADKKIIAVVNARFAAR